MCICICITITEGGRKTPQWLKGLPRTLQQHDRSYASKVAARTTIEATLQKLLPFDRSYTSKTAAAG